MNPLVQGLFNKFRETEDLLKLRNADAFELFATSLILPDELLAQAEKTDFLLDGGTTGIDVVALDINGQLAWDASDAKDLCEATGKIEVSLHFIQAKQSSSISSVDVLNFGDTVKNFLNNSGFEDYPRLGALAAALHYIFAKHATSLKTSPHATLHFVTTAPRAATVDRTVQDRAETIAQHIAALGFIGKVSVKIFGADDLHEAWVKKNHANEVEVQLEKQVNLPKMPGVDQAILGIVSVAELLKLVQTSDGSLDERVFYDNVRGFKGEDNPVNKKIMTTLRSVERELLPVLNNGVTVVAAS